jgi:hypothetical protein
VAHTASGTSPVAVPWNLSCAFVKGSARGYAKKSVYKVEICPFCLIFARIQSIFVIFVAVLSTKTTAQELNFINIFQCVNHQTATAPQPIHHLLYDNLIIFIY